MSMTNKEELSQKFLVVLIRRQGKVTAVRRGPRPGLNFTRRKADYYQNSDCLLPGCGCMATEDRGQRGFFTTKNNLLED
jgi:hypothetical protein